MFSGIIEECAKVQNIESYGNNINITLTCSFVCDLSIDQSISHNGVCLTVTNITEDSYTVTAIKETLDRSNLGLLQVGDNVNIERSMIMCERLDGHIVQGHVDQKAICKNIKEESGSWVYTFEYDIDNDLAKQGYITVEKGSIAINGVSLTVCNSKNNSFSVAIIPYTYEHTNFKDIIEGSIVNIEFDIIGKYICKIKQL